MKPLVLALLAVCATVAPAIAADAPAQANATPQLPTAVLSKPYAATLGDMIASTMSQYAQVQKSREGWSGSDAAVVVMYNHDTNKLVLSLYGNVGSTPVDQARTALDNFRSRSLPILAWAVANTYHVGIAENDVTLVFWNRATMKEILRREDAKYLVADN
jgi:hypothetical protein